MTVNQALEQLLECEGLTPQDLPAPGSSAQEGEECSKDTVQQAPVSSSTETPASPASTADPSENFVGKNFLRAERNLVGISRLGATDQQLVAGSCSDLLAHDFGRPLHSLVIPAAEGELHECELEYLDMLRA